MARKPLERLNVMPTLPLDDKLPPLTLTHVTVTGELLHPHMRDE